MDRRAILDLLTVEVPALRARYGVKSLAVFGSMARGDDREGSDVDILVTFEGRATFRGYMGLKLDLEDPIGRRIDLTTPDTLGMPDVAWREIGGMRDWLARGYFTLNPDIVWNAITVEVPIMRRRLEPFEESHQPCA
jgi:predicted nucleotidyltransferase